MANRKATTKGKTIESGRLSPTLLRFSPRSNIVGVGRHIILAILSPEKIFTGSSS
jgi:hypothetical protein